MSHEAAEIAANDAMPGRTLSLVKLFSGVMSAQDISRKIASRETVLGDTDCALDVLGDILAIRYQRLRVP